jgi:DNA modification methylase
VITILTGDVRTILPTLPDASVNCCVTSPPYWGLRDYGNDSQIGLEHTPDQYVAEMVAVFREVRRVLRPDGVLWLNLGDSYAGSGPSGASYQSKTTQEREGKTSDGAFRISKTLAQRGLTYAEKKPIPPPGLKPKDLVGIPWRVAFALQADGWYLRQDIIWHKPNPMPESVTDRCTKAHEYMFLLAKSARYYYDAEAVAEPVTESTVARLAQPTLASQAGSARVPGKTNGNMKAVGDTEKRNRRSVWTVATQPYREAHFATFPKALIAPCILAGCPQGGTVLDPFGGSGTTGEVAEENGRNSILIELNPKYVELAKRRTAQGGLFCCPN